MKITLRLGLICWGLTLGIAGLGTALGHKGLITMGPCGGNGYFFLLGMILTFVFGSAFLAGGSLLWIIRKLRQRSPAA